MLYAIDRSLRTLDAVVDYFIPPRLAAHREAGQRARIFLISHILGPFIGGVVPIALYLLDPDPGYPVTVLALSIAAFWAFPFLLGSGVRYTILALISVELLSFSILWSCHFYGGSASPTVPWILVIPLLSFFYIGSSSALHYVVLGLFTINGALFYAASRLLPPEPKDLPLEAMQALGLVSIVAASVYVVMMALYYAKVLAAHGELAAETRRHLATATQLRAATKDAEQADAAKAEFLAKMSHELRTPLNAVIGYSQILIEDAEYEGDKDSVDDLTRILNAGQHLLKLVNEILDLSKIEAGKMELYLEYIDVAQLMRETIASGSAMMQANQNTLTVDIANDVGQACWDTQKVRSVIRQIYDNANKFTHGGTVTVRVRRTSQTDGCSIRIEIHDTGIGIASEHLVLLFEKFSVINDSSSSKYGGTGLGLALAAQFTKLLDGKISVTSNLGVGSTFTIVLPVTCPGSELLYEQDQVATPLAPSMNHTLDDEVTIGRVNAR